MVARTRRSTQPSVWLWSIVAPVALFFAYIVISRRAHAFGMCTDLAAMAVSAAIGCWPMLHLRLPIFARALYCLGYVFVAGAFFQFAGLLFVCAVFHDCP
jgi:hypothetical protein